MNKSIPLQAESIPAAKRPRPPRKNMDVVLLATFLAVLVVVTGFISPSFLSVENLRNVLVQGAPLCVVVLGQTYVLMARGIDLSVGSLMATVAVLATAFETTSNAMIPVIFLAAIALSVAVGLFNGWLVTKRSVSPFLATLAVMIVLQGLRFAYTQGAPSGEIPPGLRFLGNGTVFGIPANLLAVIVLALGLGVLLHRTVTGRKILMVGANPVAARLVGLNADRLIVLCYVICSVMAGIGGLLLIGYVGTVDNWVGRGYELDSIVAAVMGGVALGGGVGSVAGAMLGALVLMVLFNIVLILGLPVEAQLLIKGAVIVFAAAIHARRT